MRLRPILKIAFLTLWLPACKLAPPYQAPLVEVREQWKYGDNAQPTIGNLQWWKQLEDPLLDELVEEALHYNRDVKQAICRVALAYARLGIIKADLYPQLFGSADAQKQEISLASFGISGLLPSAGTATNPACPCTQPPAIQRITNLFKLAVNLSYEIDLWGRIQNAVDAALADLLAEVQVRKGVVLLLVSNVAKTYIHIRESELELQISNSTLKSYRESYRLAILRFEEGLTSELEVKQAESLIPPVQAQIIQQELAMAELENLLSILIGRVPTEIVRLGRAELWPLPKSIPAGLPAELLQQRPDILEAEQHLIAANAQIGVARAEFFPRLSLTALFGYESLELRHLFNSPSRTWNYGAHLVQPIFTGGRLINQVEQAEAIKCEAYYAYESVVLNAFKEVENALISHRKAKELSQVEEKRVSILKQYLALAQLQYNNGETDYLNVLDAERNLFAAELNLVEANASLFLTLVDVYRALGGGWVDDADETATARMDCCS